MINSIPILLSGVTVSELSLIISISFVNCLPYVCQMVEQVYMISNHSILKKVYVNMIDSIQIDSDSFK